MTPQEVVQLLALVEGLCPTQRITPDTPQAWHLLLKDIRYVDAYDALPGIAMRHDRIAPRHIVEGVRELRQYRMSRFGAIETVPTADTGHEVRERKELTRRICDGDLTRADYDSYLAAGVPMTPARPAITAG